MIVQCSRRRERLSNAAAQYTSRAKEKDHTQESRESEKGRIVEEGV